MWLSSTSLYVTAINTTNTKWQKKCAVCSLTVNNAKLIAFCSEAKTFTSWSQILISELSLKYYTIEFKSNLSKENGALVWTKCIFYIEELFLEIVLILGAHTHVDCLTSCTLKFCILLILTNIIYANIYFCYTIALRSMGKMTNYKERTKVIWMQISILLVQISSFELIKIHDRLKKTIPVFNSLTLKFRGFDSWYFWNHSYQTKQIHSEFVFRFIAILWMPRKTEYPWKTMYIFLIWL